MEINDKEYLLKTIIIKINIKFFQIIQLFLVSLKKRSFTALYEV
jgi:hypothetical protein